MLGFLLGAVAGAVAATYWRADVSRLGTERASDLRAQAADKLETAERAIVQALDNASTKAVSYLRGAQKPRTREDGPPAPRRMTSEEGGRP
jgi:uncharacterized membrane protein